MPLFLQDSLTLEVVDSVLYSDGEGGVIFIVNTDDGLLQSETTSPGASLHLVFRLQRNEIKEKQLQ